MKPIYFSELPDFKLIERRGMFDIYDFDRNKVLYLATDRFYLNGRLATKPLPGKGEWFTQIAQNAYLKCRRFLNSIYNPEMQELPEKAARYLPLLHQRYIIAPKTTPIEVKCIVLSEVGDTAWDEFVEDGSIAGIPIPPETKKGHALPFPIFAPKIIKKGAEQKRYSTFEEFKETVGSDVAQFLQDKSIETYIFASRMLKEKGVDLHSCTFEYGFAGDQVLMTSFPLTPDNAYITLRKGGEPKLEDICLDDRLISILMAEEMNEHDPNLQIHIPEDISARVCYTYERYCDLMLKE